MTFFSQDQEPRASIIVSRHDITSAQWADMGCQGGNRANRATDLILVSMPKDLGMGNRLRPFPDTPD